MWATTNEVTMMPIDGFGQLLASLAAPPTTAVFTQNPQFCNLTPLGHDYRLFNFTQNFNFQQFVLTYSAGSTEVYCVELDEEPPPTGDTMDVISIEQALPQYTAEVRARIQWLLRNGYPSITASELFAQAGVDASVAPPLDDLDAFAATQSAIWLTTIAPDPGKRFALCADNNITHPKSARLVQVVNYLLAQAMDLADQSIAILGFLDIPRTVVRTGSAFRVGPMRLSLQTSAPIDNLVITGEVTPAVPGIIIENASGQPLTAIPLDTDFYVSIPDNATTNNQCFALTVNGQGDTTVPLTYISRSFVDTRQIIGAAFFVQDSVTLQTGTQLLCTGNIICPACPVPPMAPCKPARGCGWFRHGRYPSRCGRC